MVCPALPWSCCTCAAADTQPILPPHRLAAALSGGCLPHLERLLGKRQHGNLLQPQLLATAVLGGVAESGVLEAAGKAAMQLLGSRQQGQGEARCSHGGLEYMVTEVLALIVKPAAADGH